MAQNKYRVLIVVPEHGSDHALVRACQSRGLAVSAHGEAGPALDDFAGVRHEVVFISCDLQDGSGLDLLSKIKRLEWFTDVVLVLREQDPGLVREGMRRFASDYVVMPLPEAVAGDIVDKSLHRVKIFERIKSVDMDHATRIDSELKAVSHDTKNCISSARQALEILLDELGAGPLSGMAAQHRSVISEHIENVLNILDISLHRNKKLLDEGLRAHSGRAVDSLGDFDIARLVKTCVRDFGVMAYPRGVNIEVDLPQGQVNCFGQERSLHHLLGNLLHNAVKFSPRDGRVGISLREGAADPDGLSWLEIDVRNRAPDLVREDLEDMFEDGFSREADNPDGTGFGLGYVRRVALDHGGEIVCDIKGEGRERDLCMTLRLPRVG